MLQEDRAGRHRLADCLVDFNPEATGGTISKKQEAECICCFREKQGDIATTLKPYFSDLNAMEHFYRNKVDG